MLEETFTRYDDLMNSFADALDTFPKKSGETMEKYLARVFAYAKKKR